MLNYTSTDGTSWLLHIRYLRTDYFDADAIDVQRVAVIGSGPAGSSFSTTAALRGHEVTLFGQAVGESASSDVDAFSREWSIDTSNTIRGGVAGIQPSIPPPSRTGNCMHV